MSVATLVRFATVDTFSDSSEWEYRMGRPVANLSFLEALLQYGPFREYHFFCPDTEHLRKLQNILYKIAPDKEVQGKIHLSLQIALSEELRNNSFQIFHLGDFTHYMPYLIRIRNRVANPLFPITGITHSLDGIFMDLRYLQLGHSGMAPFDRIVCTSQCGRNVIKKGFEVLENRLKKAVGFALDCKPDFHHIPLGIGPDFFNTPKKAESRERLKIPPKSTVLLSIARFSPRHKWDYIPFLELLKRLIQSNQLSDFYFILAGGADPENKALIEKVIKELGLDNNVLLYTNFPVEEKKYLYSSADIFISLADNLQETFGINILEAMASSLPVILSDFNGYRELIDNEKSGFLIPTTWGKQPEDFTSTLCILDPSVARMIISQTIAVDLEKVKDALILLSSNPDRRRERGEYGKKCAANYVWPKIIKQYEDLWTDLSIQASSFNRENLLSEEDPLAFSPFDNFSHYVSSNISPKTRLGITEYGEQVRSSNCGPITYEDVNILLYDELKDYVLQALSKPPCQI